MINLIFSTTYNHIQVALAMVQQARPEWAGRILNIQRLMLFTDIAALANDGKELYEKLREKSTQEIVKYSAISLSLALFVLSVGMRRKPSFDLTQLLKPDLLKNVTVIWSTPGLHKAAQFILTSRIAINLFSGILSTKNEQQIDHFFTASCQAVTLYKMSQLPWFKFEKTFVKPEGLIWESSGDQNDISQLTLGSHYLPQEKLNTERLKTTLESISNYCTNYFKGSRWESYLFNKLYGDQDYGLSSDGPASFSRFLEPRLVYQELRYIVFVKPTPLSGPSAPYIDRIAAWAIHLMHGRAAVTLVPAT